jgi:hypothetical protein
MPKLVSVRAARSNKASSLDLSVNGFSRAVLGRAEMAEEDLPAGPKLGGAPTLMKARAIQRTGAALLRRSRHRSPLGSRSVREAPLEAGRGREFCRHPPPDGRQPEHANPPLRNLDGGQCFVGPAVR